MPNYISTADAARALVRANRVLVIGCSGGGKTTLSRRIADHFDLAYRSLDREVFWLPGWQSRDRQEQRSLIGRLVENERWVMDGSNPSSFDLRLPRADLVFWVRVARRVALMGVIRRAARHYGSVRSDMANGCPERLPDRAFLSYIWNFERTHAPIFERNIDQYGPKVPVAVLRSHREMEQLFPDPVPKQ